MSKQAVTGQNETKEGNVGGSSVLNLKILLLNAKSRKLSLAVDVRAPDLS